MDTCASLLQTHMETKCSACNVQKNRVCDNETLQIKRNKWCKHTCSKVLIQCGEAASTRLYLSGSVRGRWLCKGYLSSFLCLCKHSAFSNFELFRYSSFSPTKRTREEKFAFHQQPQVVFFPPLIKRKSTSNAWRTPNSPWVWMSLISASGLPADVHQQLCNEPMAAAAEGAWDCGFDEPPLPRESLQVYFHPIESFRILMGFICSTGTAENLMNKVIKAALFS